LETSTSLDQALQKAATALLNERNDRWHLMA